MAMDLGGGSGKKGRAQPEMNVTPLVDVVLVLLIIFMVVMPSMSRTFWLHVPAQNDEDAETADAQQPIVVSVTRGGEFRINRDVYADREFAVRLRRMLVARTERKVFFDADDRAPFERAVHAMDLARGAGAAHIAVATTRLR
ncbi:MAG: ExbD/TolR family protein [Sandaracinaceae bacterium]